MPQKPKKKRKIHTQTPEHFSSMWFSVIFLEVHYLVSSYSTVPVLKRSASIFSVDLTSQIETLTQPLGLLHMLIWERVHRKCWKGEKPFRNRGKRERLLFWYYHKLVNSSGKIVMLTQWYSSLHSVVTSACIYRHLLYHNFENGHDPCVSLNWSALANF